LEIFTVYLETKYNDGYANVEGRANACLESGI